MVRNWNDCVDMTKVGSDDEGKIQTVVQKRE